MTDTCEKHCEANAFKIVIRGLEGEVARLKERLAQPEQEPLGKLCVFDDPKSEFGWSYDISANLSQHKRMRELDGALLYTHPPQRTEQKPVAVKRMKEWVEFLKRQSDNGQHMNIPSSFGAGTCWELATELERFINTIPPQRTEQNFCPRCGKRTNDIHTCTPPREGT